MRVTLVVLGLYLTVQVHYSCYILHLQVSNEVLQLRLWYRKHMYCVDLAENASW